VFHRTLGAWDSASSVASIPWVSGPSLSHHQGGDGMNAAHGDGGGTHPLCGQGGNCMSPPDHHATPILINLSTIPERASCCQHAHERGYRRGYRHGYVYALWDLGRYVRLPAALWGQIERFLSDALFP